MTNSIVLIWGSFGLCLAVIGLAGSELCRSGDVIAEKTGLGGSWVGLILVATVTSLPELAMGMSAVTVAGTPNIAVGDVFGSCVFNLAILVVIDFLQREESVYRRARQGHVLSAGFGILLIGFAGTNILIRENGAVISIAHIGAYTPVILALYAIAVRSVFVYEREHREEFAGEIAERYPALTLRSAVLRYILSGIVVVAAGIALPFVGAALADAMGWQQSFVGTLFVAAVTSLPELAVTLAAARIGALDMAIANLLGSNLFNIVVLAVDDLLFVEGPILSNVSAVHAVSALSAIVMTGIAIVGLFLRPKKRLFRTVAWASLGLFTMYVLNSYVIYLEGQ
jgi:cation:H+ antiporter